MASLQFLHLIILFIIQYCSSSGSLIITLTVLNLGTLQLENLYPPPSYATSRRQFNTKAHFIPLQNVLCPLVATTLHFEGLVSGGWPIFNLYLSVPQRILSK